MLASSDTKFYGTPLFSYTDGLITKNTLSIDNLVVEDSYGIKSPKLKFTIRGMGNVQCGVSLSYQDVHEFLSRVQLKFEEHYKKVATQIASGNITACVNVRNKFKDVNFIISYLNMAEYSGICARIILSKNESYVDSETIYMPVMTLASIIRLVNDYRANYCLISAFSQTYSSRGNIILALDNIQSKLTYMIDRIEKDSVQRSMPYVTEVSKLPETNDPVMTEINSLSTTVESVFSSSSTHDSPIDLPLISSSSQSDDIESAVNKIQSDLDDFFANNKDEIKKQFENSNVDILGKTESKKEPVVESLYDYDFTEKFLKNDAKNLEVFLSVAVNSNAPMISWRKIFRDNLNVDMFEGADSSIIRCVDYACSCYVKKFVKMNIEEQKEFPGMVSTIFVKNVKPNTHALSITLDLLLYFIYFGQMRSAAKEKSFNSYHNKDFCNFTLKALSSPFVFCHAITTTQDILANEIIRRYNKYREAHVFDAVEEELKDKTGITFRFDIGALKNEIIRLYNGFQRLSTKLTTADIFKTFTFLKIGYEDIINNILSPEQIEKLVLLNFGSSDVASTSDLPISILEKFGIKVSKCDTRNLIRYIKDVCKEEKIQKQALDVAGKINQSYLDVLNCNFDFSQFSEDILKAFYFWDVDRYSKIQTNYIYYTDLIKKSSLTKPQLISLLKTDLTQTSDFSDSFMAARDD